MSGLPFAFSLALLTLTFVQAGRVLLTLYALRLGAQPFAVGTLAATYSLLPMLLSWQAGRISDRFGARWPLMFSAACGSCGMLVPYFIPGLASLFVAAAMNGLSFTFYVVSMQNLIGLLSAPQDRTLNFSNYSLIVSTAAFLGPLLAGFSVDHAGHETSCLYLVLLAAAPVVLLVLRGGTLPRGTRRAAASGGVKDMLVGAGLWRVLVTSSLVVMGIAIYQFYLPIYGHGIGLSASTIGAVLAMFSAAAFAVRLVMSRILARWGEGRLLFYSFFLGAASLALLPFFQNAFMLSFVSFAFGLGMGCGQPLTMMMTFSSSAEGRSGEALGLRVTVNHAARVIGPVIFGSVGSVLGAFPVFGINALMLALGSVFSKAGTNVASTRG